MKKLLLSCLLSFSTVFASEIEELKEQLRQQQELIKQLQEKVKSLEEQQNVLNQTKEKLAKIEDKETNPFSQAKFVPDISLIADFSYVSRNLSDNIYKNLEIPGFGYFNNYGETGEKPSNAERGFNFNYSELYLSSAVDPYFDLTGIFHLSENSFEIEEAYLTTKTLPYNLKLKAGRFYSNFGRLNSQHSHVWDFVDAPLNYKAIFGNENLRETGVQLSWLAPTPFYLLTGFEIFQGDNENNFNRQGFQVCSNYSNNQCTNYLTISDTKKPNLYTFFIKPSFDIGNTSILAGFSYAYGKTRVNNLADDSPYALAGNTKIYGIDLTVKHLLDSYRYLQLQSEYIYRKFDGGKYTPADANNPSYSLQNLTKKQSGVYVEGIYKFEERWRVGLRYDLLNKNDIYLDGTNQNEPNNLYRYSAMIDFLPSEFSRIRLQYNYDRSSFLQNTRKTNQEIILQFNLAIGAHGAHGF